MPFQTDHEMAHKHGMLAASSADVWHVKTTLIMFIDIGSSLVNNCMGPANPAKSDAPLPQLHTKHAATLCSALKKRRANDDDAMACKSNSIILMTCYHRTHLSMQVDGSHLR
jgi:hypothetical protein